MKPLFYNFKYLTDRLSERELIDYLEWKAAHPLKTFGPKDVPPKFAKIYVYEYSQINSSFILNPEPLFINKVKAEPYEIFTYIKLCSFRDYARYIESKVTTLWIHILPNEINLDKLKQNRLLTVTETHIHFLYE